LSICRQVYPRKPTLLSAVGTAEKCQQPTSRLASYEVETARPPENLLESSFKDLGHTLRTGASGFAHDETP
jgi:hypothetical protein